MNPTSSLALKNLRLRGAAAAEAFFLLAGGKRRCVRADSNITSFGALGRVFVYRGVTADRTHNRTGSSPQTLAAVARGCQRSVKQTAVAPLSRWRALEFISFGRCSPLCSALVAA